MPRRRWARARRRQHDVSTTTAEKGAGSSASRASVEQLAATDSSSAQPRRPPHLPQGCEGWQSVQGRRVSGRQVHRRLLRADEDPFRSYPSTALRGDPPRRGRPPAAGPRSDPCGRCGPVDLDRRRDQLSARVRRAAVGPRRPRVRDGDPRSHPGRSARAARAAILQDGRRRAGRGRADPAARGDLDRRRVRVLRSAALSGAAYCWQCGQPILQQVPSDAIGRLPGRRRSAAASSSACAQPKRPVT